MNNRGQAAIETVAFTFGMIAMVVCFLGFAKWFSVKQKLLVAVRQGAMLYSSGRMTEREVKMKLQDFLVHGSPKLVGGRLFIQVGAYMNARYVVFGNQLDIVKIRYTSQSPWYRYTHLDPTLEEKCIIKHAATYGPGLQPFYGPPVAWISGVNVPE